MKRSGARCLEETGLKVKPLEMFGVFERVMKDARGRTEYHYLLFDYVCKVIGGKLQAADDVARVEWVAARRLGDYRMTEGTREVIERAYSGASRKTNQAAYPLNSTICGRCSAATCAVPWDMRSCRASRR